MAKPKINFLIETKPRYLYIHVVESYSIAPMTKVEGVTFQIAGDKGIYIEVSPLYDRDEIAQEISGILTAHFAPVPEVWKNGFDETIGGNL